LPSTLASAKIEAMDVAIDVARIGGLVGEPSRARMLAALMGGRALTATELALAANVAASTASSHLEKLTKGGLVAIARQGRHRYFRIASRDVAEMLEGLMALSPRRMGKPVVHRPSADSCLRRARVCYDHLAGEAGVRLLHQLARHRWVDVAPDAIHITATGEAWFGRLGVDLDALRASRRPLCRACLDWSERQHHLAGALGAALLERLFELRMARREPEGRAIRLSPRGAAFVEDPARVDLRVRRSSLQ
jgi:DNA-binding transcriptional ArsR family regulator